MEGKFCLDCTQVIVAVLLLSQDKKRENEVDAIQQIEMQVAGTSDRDIFTCLPAFPDDHGLAIKVSCQEKVCPGETLLLYSNSHAWGIGAPLWMIWPANMALRHALWGGYACLK